MPPTGSSSSILLAITILCIMLGPTLSDCMISERTALLRLKSSFSDPSNRLSSWTKFSFNCCSWQGVICDDKPTTHVVRLHLANHFKEDDQLMFPTFDRALQTETLDPSLLELKHLNYLDLSWNYFQLSPIPAFLGSMKPLRYLNLSNAGFAGAVPPQIGHLVSLRALDLGCSYEYRYLRVEDLTWVRNLSSLEYLDLSYIDLNATKVHLFEVLDMLPSLLALRISHSGLDNTYLPRANGITSTLFISTKIRYLDLSCNFFEGGLPFFLRNITSLHSLDLSQNQYNSFDPSFLPSTYLEQLDLSFNSLDETIDWAVKFFHDKCSLKSLSLRHTGIHGDISILFKSLWRCWSHSLESLDLGDNGLYGELPMEFGEVKSLKELDLSGNKLSGKIPFTVKNLGALRSIRLGGNHLSGPVPTSFGQILNLETIDIFNNDFEGSVSEAHFTSLSKLKWLGLGYNMLTFRVGDEWVPPFELKYLDMESIKIEGNRFPEWLRTQGALNVLNLHNCGLRGKLPQWLHSLKNLTFFEVSSNDIEGPIPRFPSSIRWLDLSDNTMTDKLPSDIGRSMPLLLRLNLARNSFNDTIPDSVCRMRSLHDIDLSENRLSGNLPECLLGTLSSLWIALFSSNQLVGPIPNSIGGAYSLEWLHLNNNSFTGQLPTTLKNCSGLISLDAGDNKLYGPLPEWIGHNLLNLAILRLRNNDFYGTIPLSFCRLDQIQIMDLAQNKLTGNIPRGFGSLSGMILGNTTLVNTSTHMLDPLRYRFSEVVKGVMREYIGNLRYLVNLDLSSNDLVGGISSELMSLTGLTGFNLSHNRLSGRIPVKIGDIVPLESLDLSSNDLFGSIPESLSRLAFLSHLNLSNNNLSGEIPTGSQLQTLNGASYEGNPGLCGVPLVKRCEVGEKPAKDGERHGEATDKVGLYAFIFGGFATGFWGYFGVLVLKSSWRIAMFGWMDDVLGNMMRMLQWR